MLEKKRVTCLPFALSNAVAGHISPGKDMFADSSCVGLAALSA